MDRASETSVASEFNRLLAKPLSEAVEVCKLLSYSNLLPRHLTHYTSKKSENYGKPFPREVVESNLMLIALQLESWGWPLSRLPAVAGESYVVGGKLAFQGKLVTAVLNSSGKLQSNLDLKVEKHDSQGLICTASAKLKGENEPRYATWTLTKAKTQNDMWTDDPEQILRYATARRWGRTHCPEVMLGFYSPDELTQGNGEAEAVHVLDLAGKDPTDFALPAQASAPSAENVQIIDETPQEVKEPAEANYELPPEAEQSPPEPSAKNGVTMDDYRLLIGQATTEEGVREILGKACSNRKNSRTALPREYWPTIMQDCDQQIDFINDVAKQEQSE
ncbi:MAG: hypothetical protein GTO41_19980 [Burkholderiales bacterium]|nr:hypothetical protein [Burkholderiales bacterium]